MAKDNTGFELNTDIDVQLKVDKNKSKKNINDALKEINKQDNKVVVVGDIKLDLKDLKNASKEIGKILNEASKNVKVSPTVKIDNKIKSEIEKEYKEQLSIADKYNSKLFENTRHTNNQIKRDNRNMVKDVTKDYKELGIKLKGQLGNIKSPLKITGTDNESNKIKTIISSYKDLEGQIVRITTKMKNGKVVSMNTDTFKKSEKDILNALTAIDKLHEKNTQLAVDGKQLDKLHNSYAQLTSNIRNLDASKLQQLTNSMKEQSRSVTSTSNYVNELKRLNGISSERAVKQELINKLQNQYNNSLVRTQEGLRTTAQVEERLSSLTRRSISQLTDMSRANERTIANGTSNIRNSLASINQLEVMPNSRGLRNFSDTLSNNLLQLNDFGRRVRDIDTGDVTRNMGDLSDRTREMGGNLNNSREDFRRFSEGVREGSDRIRSTNDDLRNNAQNTRTLMGDMTRAMSRVPVWGLALGSFYGTVRGVKSVFDEILAIDKVVVEMNRVASGHINTEYVFKNAIDSAKELGRAIGDVAQISADLLRTFGNFDEKQIQSVADTIILSTNISDLTTEQATSSLIATLNAFNMKAEDSLRIINSMNEVDNNMPVSTLQLATAMQKSAASAETYGVSLEKLEGYIAAISATTAESGNITGNSLKTIFSRIQSDKNAIKYLADMGIAVKDFNGESRANADILDDLASKWGGLSKAQQQNTALAIGGTYQLTRFLALMGNYEMALEATELAINSEGSAYKENAEYLKSYEARITAVKNSFTEMSLIIGEASMGDALTGTLTGLTGLTTMVGNTIKVVGALPLVIGAATTAMLLFFRNSRQAQAVGNITTNMFSRINLGFRNFQSNLESTNSRTRSAMGGFRSMFRSTADEVEQNSRRIAESGSRMSSVFSGGTLARGMAGGLVGIAASVGSAIVIEKSIQKYGEYIEKKEAEKKLNEEITQGVKSYGSQIENIVEEYTTLSNIQNRSADEEQRLIEAKEKLVKALPLAKQGVDEYGNAIVASTEKLQGLVTESRKLSELKIASDMADIRKNMHKDIKELGKIDKERDKINKKLARAERQGESADKSSSLLKYTTELTANSKKYEENLANIRRFVDNIIDTNTKADYSFEQLGTTALEISRKIVANNIGDIVKEGASSADIEKYTDKMIAQVENMMLNIEEAAKNKAPNLQQTFVDEMQNVVKVGTDKLMTERTLSGVLLNSEKDIKEFSARIESIMASTDFSQGFSGIKRELEDIYIDFGYSTEQAEQWAKGLTGSAVEIEEEIKSVTDEINEMNEAYTRSRENIVNMSSSMESIFGEQLSVMKSAVDGLKVELIRSGGIIDTDTMSELTKNALEEMTDVFGLSVEQIVANPSIIEDYVRGLEQVMKVTDFSMNDFKEANYDIIQLLKNMGVYDDLGANTVKAIEDLMKNTDSDLGKIKDHQLTKESLIKNEKEEIKVVEQEIQEISNKTLENKQKELDMLEQQLNKMNEIKEEAKRFEQYEKAVIGINKGVEAGQFTRKHGLEQIRSLAETMNISQGYKFDSGNFDTTYKELEQKIARVKDDMKSIPKQVSTVVKVEEDTTKSSTKVKEELKKNVGEVQSKVKVSVDSESNEKVKQELTNTANAVKESTQIINNTPINSQLGNVTQDVDIEKMKSTAKSLKGIAESLTAITAIDYAPIGNMFSHFNNLNLVEVQSFYSEIDNIPTKQYSDFNKQLDNTKESYKNVKKVVSPILDMFIDKTASMVTNSTEFGTVFTSALNQINKPMDKFVDKLDDVIERLALINTLNILKDVVGSKSDNKTASSSSTSSYASSLNEEGTTSLLYESPTPHLNNYVNGVGQLAVMQATNAIKTPQQLMAEMNKGKGYYDRNSKNDLKKAEEEYKASLERRLKEEKKFNDNVTKEREKARKEQAKIEKEQQKAYEEQVREQERLIQLAKERQASIVEFNKINNDALSIAQKNLSILQDNNAVRGKNTEEYRNGLRNILAQEEKVLKLNRANLAEQERMKVYYKQRIEGLLRIGTLSEKETAFLSETVGKYKEVTNEVNSLQVSINKAFLETKKRSEEIFADSAEQITNRFNSFIESASYRNELTEIRKTILDNSKMDFEKDAAFDKGIIEHLEKTLVEFASSKHKYGQFVNILQGEYSTAVKRFGKESDVAKTLQKQIIDYQKAANQLKVNISNQEKAIRDLRQKGMEKVVTDIKKSYEERFNVAVNYNKKELELAKKSQEEKIKGLDDEIKKIKDVADARIKALRDETADEDYYDTILEKTAEIEEMERKRNSLRGDTSIEGRSELNKLIKDIDRANKDLSKLQRNRAVDKEIEQIEFTRDEMIANKEGNKESINAEYAELEKEFSEKEAKINKQKEDLLNNEEYWNTLRSNLMNGYFGDMENHFKSLGVNINSMNGEILKSSDDLFTKLDSEVGKLTNSLKDFKSLTESKFMVEGSFNDKGTFSQARDTEYNAKEINRKAQLDIKMMTPNSDKLRIYDEIQKSGLSKEEIDKMIEAIMKGIDLEFPDLISKTMYDMFKAYLNPRNIAKYDTGGIVPKDGLAYIHKDEKILNTGETEKYNTAMDALYNILVNKGSGDSSTNNNDKSIVINFNGDVVGLNENDIANKVTGVVLDGLRRQGSF